MILFKCKCGCFFSVKDDILERNENKNLSCQNCGNRVRVSKSCELAYIIENLNGNNLSAQLIPDDAQIEVKYTL